MSSNAHWFLIIVVIIIVALLGGWYLANRHSTEDTTPTPSEDTSAAVHIEYNNADSNLIQVLSPSAGATIASSTFVVSGKARGSWYFEASFPLEVVSATGTQLLQKSVQAGGDWMIADFVPFSATTTLPSWYHGPATLILHNDNPSGLPENEKSVSIPIVIQ